MQSEYLHHSRNYITLFSCAGVGCYGFKMNGFECIATNELLEPRIEVQRANHKCKYESGYICGDATSPKVHEKITKEIEKWKDKEGVTQVDVIFATPPCQGMSTANYKKNDNEQQRNSLVVQAIKLIKEIQPKIFVFENVRAFMKSICTDISGEDMLIKESIYKNLSEHYNIFWNVINFKDYGVPSSRPRTLVIGTSKQLTHVSPLQLFPTRQKEIVLKDSIGGYPRLEYCQKDNKDPFHFARPFPAYMLEWIKDLKEGETAFDNPDDKKPCTFDAKGNRIINKGAYMGNKYRRLIWNRPGACIATRSDVMSSQDTIHPSDNRVLSIRELMTLMTIPDSFKWTDHDDQLTVENSDDYLKENEGNIRRCIGEAVPTQIVIDIANKIRKMLDFEDFLCASDMPYSFDNNFYIEAYKSIGEIDTKRAFEIIRKLPSKHEKASILVDSLKDFVEYMPQVCAYYSTANLIEIDIIGLNDSEINILYKLLNLIDLGSNVNVCFKPKNLMASHYDVIIGDAERLLNSNSYPANKKETAVQLSLFE